MKKQRDYQRLEFLGDAVIDVITINYFFNTFKNANPKELTQFKHMSVQNQEFADLLIKLNLIDDIPFHSSEAAGCKQYITKRKNSSNSSTDVPAPKYIADLFEVLVGAIHIDNHYHFKKSNHELSQLLIEHIFKHNSLNQSVIKFEVINDCLNYIVMVGRRYVHLYGFINNPKAVYRMENVSKEGTSCCIYVQFRENELIPLTEFKEVGKNKKIAKRKVAQKIVDCYNEIGEEKFGAKLIERITNLKNKTYTLDYWKN
ncbi:ribonuclease III [Anaeromyces robustus]|uniref:Ribonuclease III n=1 Tax=Anaeromyces robustus TaxID=1754192 RepID=A0A1Y1WSL6_9FUNG|nr:ribonuclease III [Anaeromyces robustus]|eukprot:ORX76531.1 ribonuclease III [Anaeromyces robustus]